MGNSNTASWEHIERPPLDTTDCEDAIEFVLGQLTEGNETFAEAIPSSASRELQYARTDGLEDWTAAFWTGMNWIGYALSGENRYRTVGRNHRRIFEERIEQGRLDHDLGFLYIPSAVAEYELTDNQDARELALRAAEALADRYDPTLGIIEAWDDLPERDDEWVRGRFIVDTMMNIQLLYWAAAEDEDAQYREIATSHAESSKTHLVREDGSTVHTFKFDVSTGEPVGGGKHQGYADDSCWTRGQAWAIYGFALTYRHTGDRKFLKTARQVADYYLEQLPASFVPPWDFDSPNDRPDTSAAAIAAGGLAELASLLPIANPRRRRYENAALQTLHSLSADYTTEGFESNGILRECVYHMPEDEGVGECCIFGDYFYVETLYRALEGRVGWWSLT